jgi:hypothetical protein
MMSRKHKLNYMNKEQEQNKKWMNIALYIDVKENLHCFAR